MDIPKDEEAQVKELFKQAILELLQERRDEFYDVFLEVLEDISMTKAIQEGEQTELASKSEVFEALGG
ncbi:MAG: hypothetical protein U5K99_10690 [Anaerolineales bacterium]|nr:hypothetical protein [Anaerolineales bacterium]